MLVRNATAVEFEKINFIYAVGKCKYGAGRRIASEIFSDTSLSMIVMEDKKSFVEEYFPETDFDQNVHFMANYGDHVFAMVNNVDVFLGEKIRIRRHHYDSARAMTYTAPSINAMKHQIDLPIGMSVNAAAEPEVEVDSAGIPKETQLEFMNSLPASIGEMEVRYHPLLINAIIRKGWVVRDDGSFIITDAGEAAKLRVTESSIENIVVELDETSIPNDLQRETLQAIPLYTSALQGKYTLRSLKPMMRKGWIILENETYSITDAGKAALLRQPEVKEKTSGITFENIVVEIDTTSIPNTLQRNILNLLPLNKTDEYSERSMRWMMRNGWVILENETFTITTDGENAKIRQPEVKVKAEVDISAKMKLMRDRRLEKLRKKNKKEKVIPIASPAQIQALKLLVTSNDLFSGFHGKTKNSLTKAGWVNGDGTFTAAGGEILEALEIVLAGNTINADYVEPASTIVETASEPVSGQVMVKLSPKQEEALLALSVDRRTIAHVHGKTKNALMEDGWINEDGTFTEEGAVRLLEVTGYEIQPEDDKIPALTPSQKDAFANLIAWETFHGKTKNTMIDNGWVNDNGNLTVLGSWVMSVAVLKQ